MILISDLTCIVHVNLKNRVLNGLGGKNRIEYRAISSLNVLLVENGSLVFHSSYLSASNSSCRTQWRPQMLGHVVPGMFVLPHPAQRNRASSGQPQGTCLVPLPPPYKEHPRIGLHLAPHSSFWCHLHLIAAQLFIQKGHRSTNFADWGLPAVSFSYFLKSDHSFHWPFLERLIYARPCVRLWGFADRVVPSGSSL